MRVSHRDRRVAADVARSTWGMLALIGVLAAVVLVGPGDAIRFGAIVGLAAAGGVFLWRIDRTVRTYVADLTSVDEGRAVSGVLRAEVESDVGFGGVSERPPPLSPSVRRSGPPRRPGEPIDEADGVPRP